MNPRFVQPNLLPDERAAARDNPDQWVNAMRRITTPDIKTWFVVQCHLSRAHWVNINGKWVPRQGIMRKS